MKQFIEFFLEILVTVLANVASYYIINICSFPLKKAFRVLGRLFFITEI
jgi:hypothetical protein